VRFFRVCYRLIVPQPDVVRMKIDQIHIVLPQDLNNTNSPLVLLSTEGNENALFRELPPPVLAGEQPDPLPVGPDGILIEPIDPVADTQDMGEGGTGVFEIRPLTEPGMTDAAMLLGNTDDAQHLNNNQLQLYCWLLDPEGAIRMETFGVPGASDGGAAPGQTVSLATGPTPAIPVFEADGVVMDNPTKFSLEIAAAENAVQIVRSRNNVILSWDGPGVLVGADKVTGPYQEVPGGAASPVTIQADKAQQFYQVRR
jgi:hypothetical protein